MARRERLRGWSVRRSAAPSTTQVEFLVLRARTRDRSFASVWFLCEIAFGANEVHG